ncbi:MAG: coproporphyrinogen III oxidase family protein [Planctomycetes bacterium]|nr:coproporphyrinogen III oxidase family protein [Planctomycetota bacterium]
MATVNLDEDARQERTGLGNYFVANYPPFSYWKPDHLGAAREALERPVAGEKPLGLYLHIPFCRKRCKFCYFRVYTDKNAGDIETYVAALTREVELLAASPMARNRGVEFVYFGGGTPSYLSAAQLERLFARVKAHVPWSSAAEITFECEPGTLQRHKLEALRASGVTRVSLGVENFSEALLKSNGRAHLSEEIFRAYGWIRELGFPQVNIDLIAGMLDESWDNWRDCVAKTLELAPDCVTIYQMELPYNTVFSKELRVIGNDEPAGAVADWPTKRAWVDYAYKELEKAGYTVTSATTAVKNASTRFVYRDSLWRGADMFGTGVASFGHVGGAHVQNLDTWEAYLGAVDKGEVPWARAYPLSPRERFVREAILLLKKGYWDSADFLARHGRDPVAEFSAQVDDLVAMGMANRQAPGLVLSRPGLIQVDRMLPRFFEPEHRNYKRYT